MADQRACVKCSKVIKRDGEVKCIDCESLFHHECCSIGSEESFKKLTARQRNLWKCESCKSEATSVKSTRSDTTELPDQTTILTMLQALSKEMKEGRKETRKRFDGLDKSVEGISESIEEFRNRISALEEDNVKVKERCESLETSLSIANRKLIGMQREILEIQQYSRRDNIEIKGIPATTNENVYTILECISRVLQIPFTSTDVSVAHRVPDRSNTVIIAKFISRQSRDVWIKAAKGKRLFASQVSQHLGDTPVYINCHLTGHNKYLLGFAKSMVQEKKLVAAWTRDEGRIFVRKSEGGRATRVWTEDDLKRLLD